jgi:hypothetical protein
MTFPQRFRPTFLANGRWSGGQIASLLDQFASARRWFTTQGSTRGAGGPTLERRQAHATDSFELRDRHSAQGASLLTHSMETTRLVTGLSSAFTPSL